MNTAGKKPQDVARQMRANGATYAEILAELKRRKMRGSQGSLSSWLGEGASRAPRAPKVARPPTTDKAPQAKAPRPVKAAEALPVSPPSTPSDPPSGDEPPLGYTAAREGLAVWRAKLRNLATDPLADPREGKAVVDVIAALARVEREHAPPKPIDPDKDPDVIRGGKIALEMMRRGLEDLLKARAAPCP